MKAVVYTQYGSPDVLHLTELAKPVPKDNEILVRVHATPVTFGDIITRRFSQVSPREFNMPLLFWVLTRAVFGFRKPKKHILGAQFSGEVAAVGKAVTRFKLGDDVFGYRGPDFGANAEYLCVPENSRVALKPANMSHEEAAALPYGALTAMTLLRKADIRPGQKVLILGASGSIGSAALQLARHYGAQVTGVCSTPRLEYVKALGADRVIDYTQEDFTRSGERYDLIFDVLGRGSFSRSKNSLKPGGRYLYVSFKMKQLLQMLWTSLRGGQRVICALSNETLDDLLLVKELAEAGKLTTIIDRCYPLEEAAAAHRYVEDGHNRGSVIISVAAAPEPEAALHHAAAV